MAAPAMVKMFAPDGSIGDIPQDKVQDAVKDGGKRAVSVLSPDGQSGYVPYDQVAGALADGGRPNLDFKQKTDASGRAEGIYQMQGADGKAIAVPYSQVPSAQYDYGYNFSDHDESSRFSKDFGADPNHKVSAGDIFRQILDGTGVKEVDQLVGGAKGAADTVVDTTNLGAHAINGAAHVAGHKGNLVNNDPKTTMLNAVGLAPDALEAKNGDQMFGKTAESIAEFMLGDEVLKGLSLGEKLTKAGKVAKILEDSPKLAKAVEIGMNALRQGVAGGALGTIHSDADNIEDQLKEGGKEGAITAGAAGTLEGITQVASPLVRKAAGKVGDLADWLGGKGADLTDTADSVRAVNGIEDMITGEPPRAPFDGKGDPKNVGPNKVEVPRPNMDKQSLGDFIKSQIDEAEMNMHDGYQDGLDKFTAATKGQTVPLKDSPLQAVATKWLPNPATEDVAGQASSLNHAVNGIVPGTERIQPLLQQLSDPASAATLTSDQLVTLRQNLGKQFRRLSWNDPNKEVIRDLFDGIDKTLDQFGAGNGDYIKLRANYKQQLANLNDPTIQKLQKGGIDDVTKYLTSGGNSKAKAEALRKILGDGTWKQSVVSQNVFLHAVQNATSEDGVVDIQKLSKNWNNIPEATKDAIFGSSPEGRELKEALSNVVTQAAKKGDYIKLTRNIVRALGVGGGVYEAHKGNTAGAVLGLVAALSGGGSISKMAVEAMQSPTAMRTAGTVLARAGEALNASKGAVNATAKVATSSRARQILTGSAGVTSRKSSKSGLDSLSGDQ